MKINEWQKRFAALILSFVLVLNLLFNQNVILSVFAEETASEATTGSKSGQSEKKEETKKEDSSQKKEEIKKEESTKQSEGTKKDEAADKTDTSKKEDSTTSAVTDKSTDQKENGTEAAKSDESTQKDATEGKSDESTSKEDAAASTAVKKAPRKAPSDGTSEENGDGTDPENPEDTSEKKKENTINTCKVTVNGSSAGTITVTAKIIKEDDSEDTTTESGNDVTIENVKCGSELHVKVAPKKDYTYISSITGNIEEGKKVAGAVFETDITVPDSNINIKVSYKNQDLDINNLYNVDKKTLTFKLDSATADQFKKYTHYFISGQVNEWTKIPEDNAVTISNDGKYKLKLGYKTDDPSQKIESEESDFIVDTTGPVFDESKMSPEEWLDENGTFPIPVEDKLSGLTNVVKWEDDKGNSGEVSPESPESFIFDATKILEGTHEYKFTAEDAYGNSTVKTAILKKDTSLPSYMIVPAVDEDEEKWYNGDTIFKVVAENTATFEGENSGIASIAVNGVTSNPSKQLEGEYAGKYVAEFKPNEGNNVENSISVVTGAGIEKTGSQKIMYDVTPIDSNVKIKYFVEKNNYNEEGLVDSTEIIDKLKEGNKSSRIIAYLYIKDELSGIRDSYTVDYGDGITLAFNKNNSGTTSEEYIQLEASDAVRGSDIDALETAIKNSHSFLDVAGNENGELTLERENDPQELFDEVSPILSSVSLGTYYDEFGAFFNTAGADIVPSFIINEENSWLNEKTGKPDYVFSIAPNAPELDNELSYSKSTSSSNHTMTAKGKLDTSASTETEYNVSLSYTDGSGNALEKGEDVKGGVSDGKYSAKVIIDNKAPVITASLYDSDKKTNVVVIDGKEYVHKDYDYELQVIVEEKYLNEDTVVITATNLTNSANNKEFRINASDLAHDTENNTYSIVKTLSGLVEGEYEITVNATDIASNIGKTVYSNHIVIDKTPPKLTLQHELTPKTGSTFEDGILYTQDYKAKFEIEDDTPIVRENVKILNLNKNADPEITGSAGTFELTYPENNETAYIYTVEYTDLSGNEMVFSDNEESGSADNGGSITGSLVSGKYQSPHIYIDTVAPVINTLTITNENGFNKERNVDTGTALTDRTIYLHNEPKGKVSLSFSFTESHLDNDSVLIGDSLVKGKDGKITATGSDNSFSDTFDNEAWEGDGNYKFIVEAKDKAGNVLNLSDAENSDAKKELDRTTIVKDTEAPKLTVKHKPALDGTFENGILYTQSYHAELTVDEDNYVKLDGAENQATLAVDSTEEEIKDATFTVDFEKSVDTQKHLYTFSYSDPSGNALVPAEVGNGGEIGETERGTKIIRGYVDKGIYTSPEIIIDNTAPVLQNTVYDNGQNVRVTNDSFDKIYLHNKNKYPATLSYEYKEEYPDNSTVLLSAGMASKIEGKVTTEKNDNHITAFSNEFNIDNWAANVEGDFRFTITSKDKAGNESSDELKDTWIVVDHIAPILTFTYPDPVNTIDDSSRLRSNSNELFYRKHQDIATELIERNYVPGYSEKDMILNIMSKETDEKAYEEVDLKSGKTFSGSPSDWNYTLADLPNKDSHSYFTMAYTDFSGNEATISDKTKYGIQEGTTYTSPVITVDNTKPLIETTFNKTPTYPTDAEVSATRDKSVKYYYQDSLIMKIVVTEENFVPDNDGKIAIKVFDFDSETTDEIDAKNIKWNGDYSYKDGKKQYTGTVEFDSEWNYTIKTNAIDLCKLKAETVTDLITIDKTKPYISIQDIENTSKSDVTFHKNSNNGSLADFFDYRNFGYFHSNLMKVKVTAHDKTSGVFKVKYVITHEDGSVTSGEWNFDNPAGKQTKYITIPKNAKDRIKITPIDYTQITGKSVNPRGGVSETQAYHDANSTMSIKINTAPSNTVGNLKYFKTAVNATITMRDKHAGIKNYEYTAGTAVSGSHNYSTDAGTTDKKGDPGTDISYEEIFSPTMAAGDTNYTNRDNPTIIKASFTDNVGNSSKAEEKIVIDNKAPVIQVAWSSPVEALNKKYYRATRTATITVNERNFNDAGVKWKINNMTGVQISGWSHNGDINTCTVAFTQDGDDFLLDFDITDYAMNSASCPPQETFTIDKTAPVISITFDKNNGNNGYYYNQTRTATLHVQEHNFNPSEVKETVNGKLDGRSISSPGTGGWSMGGDSHSASKTYDYDGDFELNFTYTDMAGNPANTIQTERFTIDKTKPVVKIINVEDHAAISGKVTPGVEYSDVNLDENQLSIKLVGNKVGNTDNSKNYQRGTTKKFHNGRVIEWSDFRRKAEVDDIYTFEVVAKDKAGNTNEPAKITFSVNRFGSNYIFGALTEELLSKDHPYTNEEIPIEVTEINVNALTEKAVSIQDENNNINYLKEGTDYTVTEGSDKYQWKEYKYVLDKANFTDEGRYNVTLSSVDGAENKMNNITKKKEIEFIIDKTKPTATISGLEEYNYTEDSHDISLRASDNYGLKSGELYVDGQKINTYDEAALIAPQGVKETLTSKGTAQTVMMKVYDWAGNDADIYPNGDKTGTYLITSNRIIQWYHNKPLFYGTTGGAAVILLGGIGYLTKGFGYAASMASGSGFWWLIFGKRRRDEEEEE